MSPKKGLRGELSLKDGRPIANPEPVEAAILSDRTLAVRFEGGPWIRPTEAETRRYGIALSSKPSHDTLGEWFFQCATSGRVRFTKKKDDKQNSRVGNDDEQNRFRRLFEGDRSAADPVTFTYIASGRDMLSTEVGGLPSEHKGKSIPPANFPIPADVAPIDIAPTPFAHAYSSKGLATMTDKFPLLEHVNCSYLSTLHHAPTLLELKKHAQALAVLIYEMSGPSTSLAQVNNEGLGGRVFPNGEPFDWLNDLSEPYVNLDPEHNVPLTTLMNTYHHDHKTVQTTQICPLSSIPRTREAKDAGKPGLPYMTHEALTKHANECLEILDHEFSAEGGLLAILPEMENNSGRNLSGRTLLGQFILFTQRLVQRVHELEIKAANAADLLSGEKVIPDRTLGLAPGLSGTDGTRPVTVAYPQHKYVLANAGAPAWEELNKMLNIKEKMDRDLHTYNLQNGLSAASQWESSRTMEFRSGLTYIDVITRYTRCWDVNSITGTPTPIFIVPGSAVHPELAVTREMEKNPHVVQVIKPQYPERLSVLEEKYENKKYEYEDIINEHRRLKQENKDHLETIAVQQTMYKDLQNENSYRRAEQQGRGVEDLAKFRNPVAEKERKLDETQRDLDQKLLATEYALRDAQRLEKAAQGKLEKLANWKEHETTKIQRILQQNAGLTAGVRATYVKNSGIIPSDVPIVDPGVPPTTNPSVVDNTTTDPAFEFDTTEPASEPPSAPITAPSLFQREIVQESSTRSSSRAPPVHGQTSALGTDELSDPWPFPFARITDYTGLILTDLLIDHDAPAEFNVLRALIFDENGIRKQILVPTPGTGIGYKVVNEIEEVTEEELYALQTLYDSLVDENRIDKFYENGQLKLYAIVHAEPPNWFSIQFDDEYAVLIATAMYFLGWDARLSPNTDGEDRRQGGKLSLFEWYDEDGRVIPEQAWLKILNSAGAYLPQLRQVVTDWRNTSFVHVAQAMLDAGWQSFYWPEAPDGSNTAWGFSKVTGPSDNENDYEWVPENDPRAWLASKSQELEVLMKKVAFEDVDEETIRIVMIVAYHTTVKVEGADGEVEEKWIEIAKGEKSIPQPKVENRFWSMDDARAFVATTWNRT